MAQQQLQQLKQQQQQILDDEEGEWIECVVDDDYEINTVYPYPIRRKNSTKIISESISNGYPRVNIKGKSTKKHIIVAKQFIPNDDPIHKTEIDHIDTNKMNYHISNLRWCTHSENNRNKAGMNGHMFIYYDELPEGFETLNSYNGHDLDGLYINHETEKLIMFNGIRYRELTAHRISGNIYYKAYDIEDKRINIAHSVLF